MTELEFDDPVGLPAHERIRRFREANPELFPYDPEPCDDCDTGISYFVCFDGIRRCRNCVHRHAAENGWDELPPPLEGDRSPRPDPPQGPPDLQAFAEEREVRTETTQTDHIQQTLV